MVICHSGNECKLEMGNTKHGNVIGYKIWSHDSVVGFLLFHQDIDQWTLETIHAMTPEFIAKVWVTLTKRLGMETFGRQP